MNLLSREIADWRYKKGFFTPNSIDTVELRDAMLGKLMLVVTEVSEAAEAVRHEDVQNFTVDKLTEKEKP